MKTFQEFVTPDMVTFLLARERAKCVAHNRSAKARGGASSLDLTAVLDTMLPPHAVWVRPDKRSRAKHDKRWQNTHGITKAIEKARKAAPGNEKDAAYLKNLDEFITRIQNRAADPNVTLEAPSTIPMFKKEKISGKSVKVIYRPISVYSNLEDKILIALASRYLMGIFNSSLHEEILSYRPARLYHGSARRVITSQTDAVANAKHFRDTHGPEIFVAECDIQKFYDIISHDKVLEAFDTLSKQHNIGGYASVRPLLKAYLDSYSFLNCVWAENENAKFWEGPRSRYRHGKYAHSTDARFCFEWVDKESFTDPVHGCYSPAEYTKSVGSIGIPQGGALSPVIADIVMNMVDQPIIREQDNDRFFNRYGDDILLMHIDRQKCHDLIETYRKSLRDWKFIYHPFEDFTLYKKGSSTRKCYWDAKSKDAFLWGSGEGQCAEWIGFVGYEIRNDGAVRLRRSTLDKKFSAINRTYHKLLHVCVPYDKSGRIEYEKKVRFRLSHLTDSIEKCTLLTRNRYAHAQMGSLDRYRNRKIHKLKDATVRKSGGFLVYDIFRTMASPEYSFHSRYASLTEEMPAKNK